LQYSLDVLLSTKEPFYQLFCISLSNIIPTVTEGGLTRFSLLNMFGRQRKGGEQLHEYLDYDFSDTDCRRNTGINVEAPQKGFNHLEQIDNYIVAVSDALDRLIDLDVTKMRGQELKNGTYKKQDTESCVNCCHRREFL
jgi:hypothetical protein